MMKSKLVMIVSGSIILFSFATVFFGSAVLQGVGYVLELLPDNPDIYKGKPIDYHLPEPAIICSSIGETNLSNCVINRSVVTVGP